MGKDTGQEQIQMQAEKQVLGAREQQASLKTGMYTCTFACTLLYAQKEVTVPACLLGIS